MKKTPLEERITKLLGNIAKNGVPNVKNLKKYALVSTERTGSTMLSRVLSRAGLGWPYEWLNDAYINTYMRIKKRQQLNLQEYFIDMFAGSYNPETNIFGLNFHVSQFQLWTQRGFNIYDFGFDKVYYIDRRDIKRQAYSLAKALKTGMWSKRAEKSRGYNKSPEVEITLMDLQKAETQLLTSKKFYKENLASKTNNRFLYEDIVKEGGMESCVRTICGDLEVDLHNDFDFTSPHKKQSTEFDDLQFSQLIKELENSD